MKKAALVVVLALADVIAAAIVFGRPADSQSETVVERMFRDDMKLSLERVDIPDAETILSAPVFRISYSLIASYEGALPGSNALSDDLNVWIKGDRLVPILPDQINVKRDFWLSVHDDLAHIPRVRLVLDFLRNLFAENEEFLNNA